MPTVAAEAVRDGDDVHANRAETSLMLALAPELVHLDRLADADDPDRTADLVFRYTAPALSTNGVTGRPSEATVELGGSCSSASPTPSPTGSSAVGPRNRRSASHPYRTVHFA